MQDTPPRTPKLLSLVAPVYDEELLIEEFVTAAMDLPVTLSRPL